MAPTTTTASVKDKRDGQSQTKPVQFAERATQAISSTHIDIQMDPEPVLQFRLLDRYDQGSMVEFLSRVESVTSNQLLDNIKSTAFDGWSAQWDESVTSTTLLHTLSATSRDPEMLVTDLSWNKTGSTVGVAFGRFDHESWCNHKGSLCTWSLASRLVEDTPTWTVETESCVMCIAFHPEIPSLIAAGCFNGQVLLAQTNEPKLDPLVAVSKMSDVTHQEPVAKVEWVPGGKPGTYNVMSIGNDGKVLTWDPENGLATPIAGSQLLMGSIPRHLRQSGSVKQDAVLGGTSFSFPSENQTVFIVATEPGYIVKCGRAMTTPLVRDEHASAYSAPLPSSQQRLVNPIQFAYAPHTGPVNAISCSTFHRNLFVSGGSDGLIHLYNVLQTKPLLTFSPSSASLYATVFSPHRATVFAATSADGLLYIFDLAHSPSLPHTTIQVTTKSSVAATSLAFSKGRADLIATGDASGIVKVWKVASALTTESVGREWRCVEALGRL
ncbi:WD repeat-containing protein 34 [Thoreauomyces humboldtii]|nr:WD repeat-containing protein 34 [Thoreauomyces humboldtii]